MLFFLKMPKSLKPKIYKTVKKVIDEKVFLCVQIKNLKTAQVRELKRDINNLTDDWLDPKTEREDSESSMLLKHGADVMTPLY